MIPIVAAILLSGQTIGDLPPDCSKAMTTPEVNACQLLDRQRETARMERYLSAARTRARALDEASESDRQRSHLEVYLQTSQKAWEAYAAIVCDGVYDQWKGGTVRHAMYLGCQTEMTRERTRVIWRDYLTYADSTPPVLPEPVEPATDAPKE